MASRFVLKYRDHGLNPAYCAGLQMTRPEPAKRPSMFARLFRAWCRDTRQPPQYVSARDWDRILRADLHRRLAQEKDTPNDRAES